MHERLKPARLLFGLNETCRHQHLLQYCFNSLTENQIQPTLAEVDKGSQRFQSDFGVVHPDQKPPKSQITLCAHVHSLVILYLQLHTTRTNEQSTEAIQGLLK